MDLRDKKAWLERHGSIAWTGVRTSGVHAGLWMSEHGYSLDAAGLTKDEMHANLFHKVKQAFYTACCNIDD